MSSATAVYHNYFKHARLVRQSMRSLRGTFVIVEDDESMSELISILLGKHNRKHEVANSVQDARELINRLGDDGVACVVVDISLPGESGTELLKWLDENHPDIPYFIYTGMPQDKLEELLKDCDIGGTEVVEKTSGMYTLMAALGVA